MLCTTAGAALGKAEVGSLAMALSFAPGSHSAQRRTRTGTIRRRRQQPRGRAEARARQQKNPVQPAAPAELDGTEAPKARIAAGDENGTNILGLFPAGYLYRGVQAKEGKEVTMKEVV